MFNSLIIERLSEMQNNHSYTVEGFVLQVCVRWVGAKTWGKEKAEVQLAHKVIQIRDDEHCACMWVEEFKEIMMQTAWG